MGKILLGITYIWIFLLWILAGLLHIWTIYIAYDTSGAFWGIVNLFFPVISQIIWGYRAWSISGFESPYIQWLITLFVLWIAFYIFSFIVTIFSKETSK